MKNRYIILIIGIIIISFIIWSLVDTTCKPCTALSSDNPLEAGICVSMCFSEPRWYGWFR